MNIETSTLTSGPPPRDPSGRCRIKQWRKWTVPLFLLLGIFALPSEGMSQCPTPTNAQANSSTICVGGTSNIRATTIANHTISWYTVPTGGSSIGTSNSNANFPVSPTTTTTYYAGSVGPAASGGSQTFNYNGSSGFRTFTVPAGVTSISIDVRGGQGRSNARSVAGGLGGRIVGGLAVTPGEVLRIYVGGGGGISGSGFFHGGGNAGTAGCAAARGGGGGGRSEVRRSPYGFNTAGVVAVAGGGGGAGGDRIQGCGPGSGGGGGGGWYGGGGGGGYNATGGGGGTASAGGAGGVTATASAGGGNGTAGGLSSGGTGGVAPANNQAGSNTGPRGGAGGANTGATGLTGNPNWRGGGGGGGSNRSNGMNNVTSYRGWQSGNGQVVIRWLSTSGCNSTSRAPVTVTVVPDPTVSISSSGTICVGGNRTLTATTSGGTGTCTFQWQRRPVGGSWTNVGSNSSSYNTGSLSSTFQYRVVRNCNGSGCNDPGSNVVTVTVVPDPTVSISSSGTICVGGNRTLTATTSGGTGTCTFQWQRRPVGGSWTNVGTNSSTYNTGTLTSTFQYRVVRNCNGSGCNDPGSNVVTVTVVADPTVSISSGATICVGGNRTFTATTSGGTGTCTFQWQRRPVGGSWTNVGTNSSTYNTGSLSSTFQYRVVRNCNGSGCNDPGSNISTVTVVADPSVSITGGGAVCLNGNRTLTATTSGGTGTCTFQWQRATSTSGPWTNVGTNSSTYNTGALTSTFVYRVLRNCNGSGCNDPTSNTQTVTVDNVAPNALCQNVTVQLNASGNASVTANQVNNGSSDNCALSAISVTPSSFNCSNLGGNTVTFTAADNNGNSSTCTATVTVQDNIAPTVTCQNITVNIPASLTASVTPAQVTSTLSDNCAISSSSVSPNSFDCADLGGTFTVTVSASDASGNNNSCTASVTVADPGQNCNAPPVAVCQDITVNANGNCQGIAVATDFDGGSSDPDLDPLTFSVSPAGPYALGTTNVTLTVTDPSGETDNCTATITVEDNTPPAAVCQNATVQLNAAGNGSITAAQINNGSADNCSISAISVTPSSFNCSDVGGNTVTLTVTDGSGNNSTCTATVTVQDNVAPVANCQDVTVQLNAAGNGSVTAAQVNNGSSDACGISSLSVTPSSFTCSNVGNNTVTLTVTDNNTNSSTCTATVTVQDNVAPVANCQDVTVQLNAGGNGSVTAAQVNNGSSDACGISSLSVTPSSFTCSNVGNNTVTLTVTDNNSNSSTCTATVNVQDNVAPVAICQDVTVQLNAGGNGSVTAAQVNNGSSDACGISSLSVTPSSFNCSNVGNNTVTLTVTDNNSNSSTCTATINVQDNVAPAAICQDITVQLNASGNAAITPQDVDNGSSDACGLAGLSVTPNSFTCANVGGNTVTLTATDNNNNSSTCTASVTVEDNVNPVAICQDITVQLNASGNASITPQDVDNGSSDACGLSGLSVTPNSFTCANVGANTVTLTATDNNSNTASCTGTITVEDSVAPVAICQDITVQLGASGSASITPQDVDNGSSDACGIASLSVTPNAFTCSNVSGNTATLTVTDNNGNVSTCTGTITVEDSVAPIAICQDITVQLNASGNASITPQDVDNGSNDACGIASLSVTPNSFTCGNVGGNAVVMTVTDNNGNTSTCGATVTIEDNVNPVAICQDITVQLDASGNASITPQDVDNGSSDACGIASLSVTPNSFTCSNVSGNTATLTVTDNNGNVSTCTGTITVEDSVAPIAICQDITVQLNTAGNASITPQDVDNGSNDACGIASLSVTPNSFTCSNVGANTVTLTATDNNTNSATCTATVTVEDNVNPVAICQDITVQLDASGNTSITPQDVDNGSNDACGLSGLSVTPNSFTCANVGANTVTLTATDNNTNSSTCTASVTVEDSVAPIAICQDITVQLDASGSASITPQDVDNGSNDACGIASLSVTPNSFTCSNVNGNAVVLTVTDNNGNTSTCGATVTIEDNVNPVALCQDITVQLDASGNTSITPQDVDNGSNDACGIASLSVTPNSFTCANEGANTVTLTATDNNNNSSTCTAVVTVEDNVNPVAICQDITVQLDASGNTSITPQDVDNGSNDACGIASLSVTPNSFTCANVGGNTVTLTVTDNNSNSSTCTAVVAVEDNVNPVAICQDITVQLDAAGNTSITPQDIDNGSNDACGIASLSVTPNSFTCANVGGNTVTLTVTDNNTNSSTCTAIVSVEDNVDPVAICQDITIQLDATGNTSITPQQVDNGSNDACGIASLAVSPNSFVCADTGSNAVVLTVADNNGNVSTCGATVTVEDNVNPVAVCQDITVQLAANGTATITPQDVDNGSGDACGVANLSIDINTFSCNNVAGNTVTLTVTDNNGNSSSCTATVTIQDNVPPVAVCQDITVQLDSMGLVSILPQDVDGGTNDACGVAVLELSDSSFICADTNANTVILTASDVNGNSSNCTATVTVEDNIAPVVLCMDATVSLNSLGEATLLPLDVDAGTSDNCGLQSLIVVPGVYGCQDVQGVTATLRAIDVSGNLSTCTMQITVLDQVLPVAQCQDVTVQLDATGNGATTPFDVDNGSNDACGIATYVLDTQTFDCGDVGTNPVVLTVTDNNGNVNTCNANVEVEDNVNPIAICQDLTIQLDASGNASITPQQVDNGSNDACGIQSLALNDLDFTCADVASGGGSSGPTPTDLFISEYIEGTTTGDQILEFFNGTGASIDLGAGGYAVDLHLNGSATASLSIPLSGTVANNDVFVLADNNASALPTNAADQIANFNFTGDDAVVLRKGTITLDIFGVIGNDPGNRWFDPIQTTIGTRNQTLVRLPSVAGGVTTNPTGTGANAFTTLGTEWSAQGANNFTNLGSHTFAGSTGGGGGGNNTVTLTVTDVNGNASICTADIRVEDNVDPVAICQDVTVQLDASGNGSTTPQDVDNGSNDACGIDSLALSQTDFVCSEVGANTETLTVFDVNGNSSTCTATVTVEDNVPPVALCQDVTVQLDASGNGSTTAQAVDNGSNDACGIQSLVLSQTDFVCSEVGANTETLTVTDVNGNVTTCTATVTVEDNVPPVAICQDVTVQLDATGNGSTTPQDVDNGSNDACGIQSLVLSQTAFVCSEVGANTEVLTVTDNNGNVTTCTATVTVEDNVPPVAICQDVTVQLDASGNGSTTAQDVDNGSNDACGIQSISLSQTAFVCSEVGPNTEVLTVTDVNGNVSTCSATVTVEDNVPPVAICQDVTVQLDASGNGSTTAQDVDNGSNDACGIQSLVLSQTDFVCSEVGANTEVLTVTDVNGNVTTCTTTVTVEDNVPPVAICQDVTVQLDASGNGSTTPQDVDNGSNDACGIQSLVLSQTAFVCSEVGPNTEVLTVTDVNGNVTTCTTTVTVEDNVPPVAICQDVTVQLDASGNGSTTAQAVDNGSNDACGIQSLVLSQTDFVCSEVGANTEVLTVTDVNGNVSTCTTTVTVEDNVPPVAICQDVTVQLDASGNGSTTPQDVDNGSNDACGIQSLVLSQTDFVCSEVGANTEVLTVTDVNGNVSTCSATVTVEDNVPPVAICQDVTVQLDASGNGSTTAQDVDNGSNDACGIQSLVLSQTDFVCSEVGPNTEVLTVTDVNGNVSTCTTTVTVEDNVPPVAICQDVTVQLDASGNGSTTAQDVDNGSNDACGIQSLVLSQTDFVCSEVGANTEVLTVTDVNGNVSTCTTTVTVEDNVPPVAICQNVTINLPSSGNASITAQDIDNGSNDACGIDTIYLDMYTFNCTFQGPNTVTLTVVDVNGNVSTCTATVTVTVDPLVAVLSSPVFNCGYNISCFGLSDGEATATVTGGCLPYTYLWNDPANQTTATASNLAAGTYAVTVTDVNGNTTTESITLTQPDSLIVDLGADVAANFGCSCVDLAPASIVGGCQPYNYLWGTNETTNSITVCPKQTTFYPVTITDDNGCQAKDSVYVIKPSAQGQTDEYVVLGLSRVIIGDQSFGINGAIGVNGPAGQLTVGSSTDLDLTGNNWILGENISIGNNSNIGDIYTNTAPTVGAGSGTGSINPLPTPGPTTPCAPAIPGGNNITVPANQTVNLTPGNYGTLYIATRGVLSMAPGIYTFTQINTASSANFISASGLGSDVGVFVSGTVGFGDFSSISANIAALTSRIQVGNGATVYGSLVADQVSIGRGCALKLESFCWPDANCGINKEEVAEIESSLGDDMEILAYPNPFRESTTLQFRLVEANQVTIEIYNVNGVHVTTLFNEAVEAGVTQEVTFTPEDKTAGLYFYRLTTGKGEMRNGKLIFQR